MKDFLYINYNIVVDKIINNYFFINDDKIIIIDKIKDLKKVDYLVELTNDLYYQGLLVNTFIKNTKVDYYSKKDNYYIALLKVNDREDEVLYNQLIKFNNKNNKLEEINIIEKWKKIIDDIELKITEYNDEFILIQNSINYYIGLGENAIQLLNEYEIKKSNDIGHDLNYFDFNNQQINNPFTLINVNKMYDISNYIKHKFFNNNLDYEELYNILNTISDEYDESFLLSSLLFPNYYFDLLNEIFESKKKEEAINNYVKMIKKYESLILFCKKHLKKSKYIELINWFKE